MTTFLRTTVTDVGPDVADLAGDGMLILFAEGAPPELAEVSVLHRVVEGPDETAPAPGDTIQVGTISARITAMGEKAWAKVRDIGHVVVTFNGADTPERPGEICAEAIDNAKLLEGLSSGTQIVVRR